MKRFQYGNTRTTSTRYADVLARVLENTKPEIEAWQERLTTHHVPNRLKGVTVNSRGEAV